MYFFWYKFQKNHDILFLVKGNEEKMNKETLIDGNKTIIDTDYYNFLIERENKLQMIEQMFKSGSVDLSELAALVEEK
jgi:hypothetical protein